MEGRKTSGIASAKRYNTTQSRNMSRHPSERSWDRSERTTSSDYYGNRSDRKQSEGSWPRSDRNSSEGSWGYSGRKPSQPRDAASEGWTTVGNDKKERKPRQERSSGYNYDRKPSLKTKVIKNTINRGLAAFVDFEGLLKFCNLELSKLSSAPASKFLETMISWSLHEIFKMDESLLSKLRTAHESDGYKIIHWAVWPRYKTHPAELDEFPRFRRSEGDILETIKICLSVGSSPLDSNDKKDQYGNIIRKESAIGSLIASYNKGYMSTSTFGSAYNLLTVLPDEAMWPICTQVVNLLSDDTDKNLRFGPIISWMVHSSTEVFCRALVKGLIELNKGARDMYGFYKKVHDNILLIHKLIKLGPSTEKNSDYAHYFTLNKIESDTLIANFNNVMLQVCCDLDLKEQRNKLTRELLNIDVIGAIIGEVGKQKDSLEFCFDVFETYPMVAQTCLVHIKTNNQDFACPQEFINRLVDIHTQSKEGDVRFRVMTCLEKLVGRQLTATSLISLKSGKFEDIAPAIPDQWDEYSDDEEKVASDSTDYYSQVNINAISKLKDSDKVEFTGTEYIPETIDDMMYGLSKVVESAISSGEEEQVMECIVFRAMECIRSDHQIAVFLQILEENKWLPKVQKIITTRGSEFLDNVKEDNPLWAEKVMDSFLPKTKPASTNAPKKIQKSKQKSRQPVNDEETDEDLLRLASNIGQKRW